MLDYLIILIIALAGFFHASWLLIILGAIGLCLDSSLTLWNLVKLHKARFDPLTASFFVPAFGNALIATSLSYIMGVMVKAMF